MANTHKYLLLSGYLTYRLTGEYRDSVGTQVGYVPFEYKDLDWYKPNYWKWQLFPPLTLDLMPELVHPGSSLGEITAEASAATGIPQGLTLIASAGDKSCEILGSGCIQPNIGAIITALKFTSSGDTGWSVGSKKNLGIMKSAWQRSAGSRRKSCLTNW
jgi:sugar (pentulose or hexulose) kinase